MTSRSNQRCTPVMGECSKRGAGEAHRLEPLEGQRANVVIAVPPLARRPRSRRHRCAPPGCAGAGARWPGASRRSAEYSSPSGIGGNAHLVGIRARQKAQPEDLEPVDGGHAVQVLIHRAHQHLAPEAVDGARRLALLEQPVEHADAVQVLAPRAFPADGQQRARDAHLVGARSRQRMRRNDPVK